MKQPFIPAAVPSGSVYSTAHDLGLYLQSHLGRADLAAVSPSMYATLHQPVRGYAMGWFEGRTSPGGAPALVHSGHGPGATSMVTVDPAAGWGIAVIANHQELGAITADDLGRGLTRIMAGARTPGSPHAGPTRTLCSASSPWPCSPCWLGLSPRSAAGGEGDVEPSRGEDRLGVGLRAGLRRRHALRDGRARPRWRDRPHRHRLRADVTLLALTAVGGLFVLTLVRAGLPVRRH